MRHVTTLFFVLSFGLATTALFSQTKIMPLGDSITKGQGSTGDDIGYRKPLWNRLKTNYSVDFVGTLEDGSGFDADHEGRSGWKSDEIRSNISSWLNNHDPDIVLFHIGTNDISANRPIGDIISDINGTLNNIWNHNANITVLLCSIVPRIDEKNSNTIALNSEIENLVNQHNGSRSISLIDQYNAITSISDWENALMSDYLHPNDSGYQRMADEFYDELIKFLSPVTPVELISFTGFANTQNVHLSWQTASETNYFGFNIEHRFGDAPFEKVGFIPGQGTTTTPYYYEYTHYANEPGIHKYRLQQVDTDGSFSYSETIEIDVSAPARISLQQSFPNPFAIAHGASHTNISFDLPEPASVRVAIYDLLGREIATLFDGSIRAGRHNFAWDGRTISGALVTSGTYFIRMDTPAGIKRQKIQVIR